MSPALSESTIPYPSTHRTTYCHAASGFSHLALGNLLLSDGWTWTGLNARYPPVVFIHVAVAIPDGGALTN